MALFIPGTLPTEVLNVIFGHLDGTSFSRCGLVSTRWNAIIKDMACWPNIWKSFCYQSIPELALDEMVNRMYPWSTEHQQLNHNQWKSIYIHWIRWEKHRPNMAGCTLMSLDPCQAIRCFALSGSIPVTGSSDGTLAVWGTDNALMPSLSCSDSYEQIRDIALFSLGYEDKFPGMVHDVILTTSKTRWLVVSRPQQQTMTTVFGEALSPEHGLSHKIKSDGRNKGAVLSTWTTSNNPYLRVFQLKIVPGEVFPSVNTIYTLRQPCAAVMSLSISQDVITILHYNQALTLRSFFSPGVLDSVSGLEILSDTGPTKSFRQDVVFSTPDEALADDPQGLSLPLPPSLRVRFHQCMFGHYFQKSWRGKPTVFFLYARLFVVGTSLGEVYAYALKPDCIMVWDLNLDKYTWKAKCCTLPILFLDIYHSETEMRLYVASRRSAMYIPLRLNCRQEWWLADGQAPAPSKDHQS